MTFNLKWTLVLLRDTVIFPWSNPCPVSYLLFSPLTSRPPPIPSSLRWRSCFLFHRASRGNQKRTSTCFYHFICFSEPVARPFVSPALVDELSFSQQTMLQGNKIKSCGPWSHAVYDLMGKHGSKQINKKQNNKIHTPQGTDLSSRWNTKEGTLGLPECKTKAGSAFAWTWRRNASLHAGEKCYRVRKLLIRRGKALSKESPITKTMQP